ncbi:GNAT family protein [Streptomyces sp900105245]|uniref:GNAT family protein n=1 Tax=Streptomyces sp. 900105245 TaxID=3154379 RepID=A0ABV1UKX9_9ACTN
MFSLPLDRTAHLSPLEVWHAEEFAAHMGRAADYIRPWVGQRFVTDSIESAVATLRRYAERQANDEARLFGIWHQGTLVGGVMFANFNASSSVCEIGCWLEPAAEGRGLVTNACRLLLEWAFDARGIHRAEWHCRADNERSVAVAQRLGMLLEGVHRDSWIYDGTRYDKVVWSILRREWSPQLRPVEGCPEKTLWVRGGPLDG